MIDFNSFTKSKINQIQDLIEKKNIVIFPSNLAWRANGADFEKKTE